MKTRKLKNLFFYGFVGFIILLGILFWFKPYIPQALWHTYPKIDQYTIFHNRIVKAGDPNPWKYASDFSDETLSPATEERFEDYKTVAFLVASKGEILYERYWQAYYTNSLSNSFSMAKGIVSLLLGCALEDGYIKDLDQAVSDFFPQEKQWGQFKGKALTIRNLLSMSAGVNWDEAHTALFSKTTEAYYGRDLWRLVRSEALVSEPGIYFNYQSGVTQILAFILTKATGKTLAEYASEKLWTPIQAEEDALWSLDSENGMEKAYCCFNTNLKDFARLGQLILNHGYWNEKKVVDSAYIAQATSPVSTIRYKNDKGRESPCRFYGFQFWILNYKGYQIPYFRGILGQYIFVVPELDAVVVRLGKERSREYNRQQNYPKDVEIWLDAAFEVLNKKE